MFLRTRRLFLRPIWSEDWHALPAILGQAEFNEMGEMLGWSAGAPPATARDPYRARQPQLLVTLPDGGAALVGAVGFRRFGEEVALALWVARAHRGRGYAKEAVRGAAELARLLGYGRIVSLCRADSATARVLGRLGFTPAGQGRMALALAA